MVQLIFYVDINNFFELGWASIRAFNYYYSYKSKYLTQKCVC